MAEIGLIESFYALHWSETHGHDFKVEIMLEGKIDPKTGYIKGINHHEVIDSLKKIVTKLENQDLKKLLTNEGYTSSGNESIAIYFLRLLIHQFPIKCVKIYETDNRYAVVYANEV